MVTDADFIIDIEAGSAFGDGQHPTTQGCLEALAWLKERIKPAQAIDVGCGSGILAITAAKLWKCQVSAVDVSRDAVVLTTDNALNNGLDKYVTAFRSDGYSHGLVGARAPYSLIMCNVLAEPLITWASTMASYLDKDGYAVLSGMLLWQREAVEAAHKVCGLKTVKAIKHKDWVTLILRKE